MEGWFSIMITHWEAAWVKMSGMKRHHTTEVFFKEKGSLWVQLEWLEALWKLPYLWPFLIFIILCIQRASLMCFGIIHIYGYKGTYILESTTSFLHSSKFLTLSYPNHVPSQAETFVQLWRGWVNFVRDLICFDAKSLMHLLIQSFNDW